MTYPVANNNYSIATSSNSNSVFITLLSVRDPTASDINYPITKRWVNTVTGHEFILIGISIFSGSQSANWLTLASSAPVVVPWTMENSNFSPAHGNGYVTTGTITATLPASPNLGDTIYFMLTTPTLTIQASGGHLIQIGVTSSAANGICVGDEVGSSITLVFGTTWESLNSPQGTWVLT